MKNDFNLCPMCGSKKIECKNNKKWICQDCGFDLYCNVAAAVGVILYDNENNVLFEVRKKNPQKGKLAIPGGFIDFDESAEQAVIRECKEEIGIEIGDVEFICTNPNTYPYKNIEYKTCDIFFTSRISSKYENMQEFIKNLKAQDSEVVEFVSYKIENPEDIEKLPIAFISTVKTLYKWIKVRINK